MDIGAVEMRIQPMTFGRDHHLRKQLFCMDSFNHKAKFNLYWLAWLIDKYSAQGQIVFDPFGGIGSILLAATKQRSVISGDIEPHWALVQAQNALRIRTGMLFTSPMLTCQWNAAMLPIKSESCPVIITSPPYYDVFSDWNRKSGCNLDGKTGKTGLCYGFHNSQIGNIHIYDEYLRAMREAYLECWRILAPGGILVLVVGDRVKRKRRVPITADTKTLCLANGFDLLTEHQRAVIPSQYRNIHAKHNPDYPTIDIETALICQKRNGPVTKTKIALVQFPKPNSSPGKLLFDKVTAYASATADKVFFLSKDGLSIGQGQNSIWDGDHPKARARQEWAYRIIRHLATKFGLTAGDEIALHVSLKYAQYLARRAETLGCKANIPTAKHNLGRKLSWYTWQLQQVQT